MIMVNRLNLAKGPGNNVREGYINDVFTELWILLWLNILLRAGGIQEMRSQ